MKLRILTSHISDREELRTLLIDAAQELTGSECKILEPKLPWDGHPILLADEEQHPVLVSFDPEHGQTALLNGLQAAERLSTALPWINQVYDALQGKQRPPRLLVVSQELPPGANSILTSCPKLDLFRYKVLSVNGETGLWLEHVCETSATARTRVADVEKPTLVAAKKPADDALPSLSDEETAYFQQL